MLTSRVYYAPSADGLLVTLNENVLKHAIDRRLARAAAKKLANKTKSTDATAVESMTSEKHQDLPWLGDSFCLQVDRRMMDALSGPLVDSLGWR